MSERTLFTFSRGQTASWMAEQISGVDPLTATGLVSRLKPIKHPADDLPGAEVSPAATLSVVPVAGSEDVGAGWVVTMSGVISAGLTDEYYATDIKYEIAGLPYITRYPLIIRIIPAISI